MTSNRDLNVETTKASGGQHSELTTTSSNVHLETLDRMAVMNMNSQIGDSTENGNLDTLNDTTALTSNETESKMVNENLPSAGLNVETIEDTTDNNLGGPVGKELNVETNSVTPECKQPSASGSQQMIDPESDLNQEWQKDIEHLTNLTQEVNRTNTAIGLLLLNSPKSTHADTKDDETRGRTLLMPVGGEKQLDVVLEMEKQKQAQHKGDSTKTKENDTDSDATIELETPIYTETADEKLEKSSENSKSTRKKPTNGTLVIRSYKLRHKTSATPTQKMIPSKRTVKDKNSGHKKANELGESIKL